jgi:tetratricopeptide (TPR) repeat protein
MPKQGQLLRIGSMTFFVLRWTVAVLFVLAAALPCLAQAPATKTPEWVTRLGELTKARKFDEAIALVRAKAAEEPPAAEVPQAMFRVAQWLYGAEKYDESLKLLTEIIDRFPKSPVASLAWCGKGQVYGRQGKTDEMIAALERGMAAPRAWTETNVMDAGDTHGYACQVLGEHYLKSRQWDKALAVYTAWKPNSWCGTCLASMDARRSNSLLLCEVNLGRFDAAVERAWNNLGYDGLAMFVLVRLYAEANQLDDLDRLVLEHFDREYRANPIGRDRSSQFVVQAAIETTASFGKAIKKARRRAFDDHLVTLRDLQSSAAVEQHVARWALLQGHRSSVQQLSLEVLRSDRGGVQFLELLAVIDTPAARKELVQLAVTGDVYRQQMVCGFIRHRMKDSQPLIAEIVEKVPADRTTDTNWNIDPLPTTFRFYAAWTPPREKSLPKTLPPKSKVEN